MVRVLSSVVMCGVAMIWLLVRSGYRPPASMAVKVGLMSNGDSALGGGQLLAIGALAELTGKRPSSIRYYEQIGLLPQPVRIAGRRMYDPATVRTLAMIEPGHRAGFALTEIKRLLPAPPGSR